ncbi:hypothetical protein [Tenacibaculum sp. M341]|uniref:hypothetical protein n=1 Tax=Tenacibaculum sp. M341 TaxID=2530339 RepID=UPI00104B8273|nr:hypothetical protein [Tenacibaculum sp. M341]TCI92679.1 hypothetical protein EYW44_07205 [Tenacibaculum sp. M341]
MKFLRIHLVLLFAFTNLYSQTTEKEALKKLSFIIGNWEGKSISYNDNNETKEVAVVENVQYIMDGNLISLDVKSPWIALHTIISYSTKDKKYYYYPFSKEGNKKGYEGRIEGDRFLVYFNASGRLTFTRTAKGEFHEYGEKLVDGKWKKYFEDILQPKASKK